MTNNNANCINVQIADPEIFSILTFLEKAQGLVSLPHFVYDFLRKIFLMLYIIITDQIIS